VSVKDGRSETQLTNRGDVVEVVDVVVDETSGRRSAPAGVVKTAKEARAPASIVATSPTRTARSRCTNPPGGRSNAKRSMQVARHHVHGRIRAFPGPTWD
jgi:hypothetical protein